MKKHTAKRLDFEAQALPYLENLYRTALYVAANVADASEMVLESFTKAYRFWYKRESNPDCKLWLFKIMVTALRDSKDSPFIIETATSNADLFEDSLVHERSVHLESTGDANRALYSPLSKVAVKKSIQKLPADIRLITVLSLMDDFSYREIAEILGISLISVKARMLEGRKLMERSLVENIMIVDVCDMSAVSVRSRRAK